MQFWVHNLDLPVLLVSLAASLKGHDAVDPLLGLASFVVGSGVLLFAYRVLVTLRALPIGATGMASGRASQ